MTLREAAERMVERLREQVTGPGGATTYAAEAYGLNDEFGDLKEALAEQSAAPVMVDGDAMCPACLSPWKCNGCDPHGYCWCSVCHAEARSKKEKA